MKSSNRKSASIERSNGMHKRQKQKIQECIKQNIALKWPGSAAGQAQRHLACKTTTAIMMTREEIKAGASKCTTCSYLLSIGFCYANRAPALVGWCFLGRNSGITAGVEYIHLLGYTPKKVDICR